MGVWGKGRFFLRGSVIPIAAGFCYRQVAMCTTMFTRHQSHNFLTLALEHLVLSLVCFPTNIFILNILVLTRLPAFPFNNNLLYMYRKPLTAPAWPHSVPHKKGGGP
jgi:hypothetical protein